MPHALLDGPMGTELIRRGVTLEPGPWSATGLWSAPGEVLRIHRAYAVAGATIHRTNTFRTQPHILGPSWATWLARAVALARIAVPRGHLVWGSLAPVDDCYAPEGRPSAWFVHEQMAEAFAQQGVDGILCETFADPDEAVFATRAAVATGLPSWISLTAGPQGDLLSPDRLAEAASRCMAEGARGVMLNCVAASRCLPYVKALGTMGVPWGVLPNAGSPHENMGWSATPDLDAWTRTVSSWLSYRPHLLGGCCGTGPTHVHRLRSVLTTPH